MYRRPVLPQAREPRPPTTVSRNFVKTILEPVSPPTARTTTTVSRQPVNSTAILSDATLIGLAARQDVRAEFPFMRAVSTPAGKACCGAARAARQAVQRQVDAMKAGLSGAAPEQKVRFKEILKVGRVALYLNGTRIEF